MILTALLRSTSKLTNLFKMNTTNTQSIKEELPPLSDELSPARDMTDEEAQAVKDSVGGEVEYSNMITWAFYCLPQDEEDTFDWIVERGEFEPIKHAADRLHTKYRAACDENEDMEEDITWLTEINAAQNRYSLEAIEVFRNLRKMDLDSKDWLQIARVATSYALASNDERLDAEVAKDEPNVMGVRWLTIVNTLLGEAKKTLWGCKLPHEIG